MTSDEERKLAVKAAQQLANETGSEDYWLMASFPGVYADIRRLQQKTEEYTQYAAKLLSQGERQTEVFQTVLVLLGDHAEMVGVLLDGVKSVEARVTVLERRPGALRRLLRAVW